MLGIACVFNQIKCAVSTGNIVTFLKDQVCEYNTNLFPNIKALYS